MKKILSVITVMVLLGGCAHVISPEVLKKASMEKGVTFSDVKEDIQGSKDELFVWGGLVVGGKHTKEGSFVEILQVPVDSLGRLLDPDASEGRFLMFSKKHLDPLVLKKGRAVTVAGVLTGSESRKFGEGEYEYPVLQIEELYIWRDDEDAYELHDIYYQYNYGLRSPYYPGLGPYVAPGHRGVPPEWPWRELYW